MRHNKPTKEIHRALFLALQADAKEFPGGIRALADAMGMNGNTLSNGINPDHDAPPPSFAAILEIITLAQAKRAMFALAQLVGQVPLDMELEDQSPAEAVRLFLSLISTASELFGKGTEAAKDFHFNAAERQMLEPLLLSLMQAAGQVLKAVRG